MQSLVIHETENAPIACDMSGAADTPEQRLAEYGRLFAHALTARARTVDAVELTFAARPGVGEWIADLARREAACCSFLSHAVAATAAGIVWRVSSGAGAAVQPLLDELHDLPERVGEGYDGLIERLRARGMTAAAAPAPARR